MALLDDLKWRHAVKAYDPNKKLDKAVVEQIVEAARLAPTSSGLQPFRLVVIDDQKTPFLTPKISEGRYSMIAPKNVTKRKIT